MGLLKSLASVLPLLASVHAQYVNPEACSGVCGNAHDPAIIRRDSDGTYFRFSTGGKIAIHTAPALTGPWTYQCAMLPSGSKINLAGNQDLWAPDVAKVGSTYYVYYSVSTFGSQNSAIGLATSTTMNCNSFTDVGSVGVTSSSSKPYNAIDSNLILANGNYYLSFGSFWSNLYQVQMSSTPSTTSGGASYQISYQPSGSHAREAAFMIYRSGIYYLFFSDGICCGYDTNRPAAGAEYQIKVCASSSPTGGFLDKNGVSCTNGGGTTVLASHGTVYGPGGQSVFSDPTYGWVLIYHYVDTTVGYADGQKKFGWNKLCWSGGWPSVC